MKENKKFIKSKDAVSETVGYSIILVIVVTAAGFMVVMSYPTLGNLREVLFMESADEALRMLDSRASMVAFGSSSSQVTRMSLNGGTLSAYNSTKNNLKINISYFSGNETEIFNKSIGAIEYVINNQTIAYEGGGLFRKYESGEPLMISPPEFHYNGETLTFPIMRINSTGSIGGKGIVRINFKNNALPGIIYPNSSSSIDLTNPVFGKQIKMRFKSDYYKPWAKYIKERTGVTALTNDATKEAIVSLNAKPLDKFGPLDIPLEIYGLDVTNSTPLNNFSFNLSNFSSDYHFDLCEPTGSSKDFCVHTKKAGGGGSDRIQIEIQYNKKGFNESWYVERLALVEGGNLILNLLDSSINMTYTSGPSGTWLNETQPYNRTYSSSDTGPVPLDIVMEHYFRLISDTGTFVLYPPGDAPSFPKGFALDDSTFIFDYKVMPPVITYLHIVEHDVDVAME